MEKFIHYCWFGRAELPDNLKKCIQTWREIMPEWTIVRWDEDSFDIHSTEWTKSAYDNKKYAFVSDYVRLYALYNVGGIYLDTDVKMIKSLAELSEKYEGFGGFENKRYITSAIIGAQREHPLIKEFINYYKDKKFTIDYVANNDANVKMMTNICISHGLQIKDIEQDIVIKSTGSMSPKNFHIFPQTYFCPLDFYHNKNFTKNTYTIHYFEASWLEDSTKDRIKKERSSVFKCATRIMSLVKEFTDKL